MTTSMHLTDSEVDWLQTRARLRTYRHDLDSAAAACFPADATLRDTPLLTRPNWIPREPLPLEAMDLELDPDAVHAGVAPDAAREVLPFRDTDEPYRSYSHALGTLAAPTVFKDRRTYRLCDAQLSGDHPRLRFGLGSYFDSINIGEAAAHEFMLQQRGHCVNGGIRATVGDPRELHNRPTNLAISTVTIRRGRGGSVPSFLLHWRDPTKVGHAGGMYQVVPVGIFQPSGDDDVHLNNDFSLWHTIVREFAEELLGEPEGPESEHEAIDYAAWPLAAHLAHARGEGRISAYCLGLGVDPLSFATDLLTAVVVDADVFDDLFGAATAVNSEGQVFDAQPFTPDNVERILADHSMQAAGAALTRLAASEFA